MGRRSKKVKNNSKKVKTNNNSKQNKFTKRNYKNIKKSNNWDSYISKFKGDILKLNLKLKDIEGDGNCLFRCIAYALFKDEDYHKKIRTDTHNYISDNIEYYQNYIDTDDTTIEEYLNDLKKDGTWGGQLEINAICQIYKINILIFTSSLEKIEMFYFDINNHKLIKLAFHKDIQNDTFLEHYDLLKFNKKDNNYMDSLGIEISTELYIKNKIKREKYT